ncbi:Flagellar hook-associated protein 3 [Austwickia sp. TVS 96-490-7B]|uniref:flagellar hook-associated protein FlgL n=1 Tax=Austwickia sp. TVS 96-490-7B TaxID=2830843 RepID=UPI001C59EC46|nr:flagellar hook-associated protein FlgL [Austwickia sp. TVS 96-490-7B]MBW3087052.1 Flagellar hook-associated protein 3 [Austwickia sp. TVS 96-490-7B]
MRITQNSMNRTQLMGLDNSLARLQRTQETLTSGKRLVRPSDSPVDTVSAMRLRDQQRALSALGENIKDGVTRLQAADDALTRSQTMLTKVRSLVVAGANGTNSPQQRAAYANEIEQIREGMIHLANTQYAGQPVFGGTSTAANAFDNTTGAFLGNTDAVLRKVTEATGAAGDIDVAVSGWRAFKDPADAATYDPATAKPNLFFKAAPTDPDSATGLLDRVVRELRKPDGTYNPATLSGMLGDLDKAAEQLSSASSTVGARVARLNGLGELNGRLDDGATVALSKVEDVDFMKAAMDLNIQANAYNAALQASAKIIQPSLMDFLR